MKKLIVDCIRQNGCVSFLTLADIPGFKGDLMLELHTDKGSNIGLWFNCSEEAIDALNVLKKENIIEYRAVSPKEYFLLGFKPPIKSAVSVRHYKEQRWYPVAVVPGKELRRGNGL